MEENPKLIFETNVQSLTITTYTQYQNKLLMGIIANEQSDIKEAIFNGCQESHPSQFTPAEMAERMRHREIPLCALEPHKGHHQRARKELMDMSGQGAFIPIEDKNKNITYHHFKQLFKVDFQKKGNKIMVMLDISTDLLYYYNNVKLGWHKLNLDEMLGFRLNATRNMYRLYYGYFAYAKTPMKVVQLGCLLSKKMKFANCAEIIKNLVQPAKEEMENAFYAGKSEIYFDYELADTKEEQCKATDKQSGNGDADNVSDSTQRKIIITFFTKGDDNPTGQQKYDLEQFQAEIKSVLIHAWGVHDKTAIDISSKVKVWMLPTLGALLTNKSLFAKRMRESGKPMLNEAGYIVKHIGIYFDTYLKKKAKSEERGHQKYPNAPDEPIL